MGKSDSLKVCGGENEDESKDCSLSSVNHYLEREREDQREGVKQESQDEYCLSDAERGLIEYDLLRVKECGTKKFPVYNKKTKKTTIITLYCEKPYCPRCGKKHGLLHKRKSANIIGRLGDLKNTFIREFIFTLPHHLTPDFESKNMLNRFFDIVKRLIEKEFGILVSDRKTKKGIKRKYRLQKKVLATLELSGDKGTFHPHVNVLIFEENNRKNKKDIPPEQLERIKKSYKNALEKLLREKLEVVNVHYSYRTEE
jgi:hypothetical protein